jgi:hypothetical protein
MMLTQCETLAGLFELGSVLGRSILETMLQNFAKKIAGVNRELDHSSFSSPEIWQEAF